MSRSVEERSGQKIITFHERVNVDDHVFVWVECEGRPAISIDLLNAHGRRCVSVRADGYGLFSGVVDVAWLGTAGSHRPKRFCSECGAKHDLFSSRPHICIDPLPSDDVSDG